MRFELPDPNVPKTWAALGWQYHLKECPLLPGDEQHYRIASISPKAFLRLVDRTFAQEPHRHRLASLHCLDRAADAGEGIAPLQVWPSPRIRGVLAHEGRHRALTAIRRGVPKVPIIVWNVPCPAPWT